MLRGVCTRGKGYNNALGGDIEGLPARKGDHFLFFLDVVLVTGEGVVRLLRLAKDLLPLFLAPSSMSWRVSYADGYGAVCCFFSPIYTAYI